MKIIVGCPVKDREWVLEEWHRAVMDQDIDLDVLCLVSRSEDNTESTLEKLGVEVVIDEGTGRTITEIDGHQWGSVSDYGYMAGLRNRLLDLVIQRDADYFFSLDSDIILSSGALSQLFEYMWENHAHIVAPAVNMAIAAQAWNTMNFTETGAMRTFVPPTAGPVDVVMAAMLLDRHAVQHCHWAAHSQGEDVGFCLSAQAKGIKRYWVPDVRCTHLMQRSWLPPD